MEICYNRASEGGKKIRDCIKIIGVGSGAWIINALLFILSLNLYLYFEMKFNILPMISLNNNITEVKVQFKNIKRVFHWFV